MKKPVQLALTKLNGPVKVYSSSFGVPQNWAKKTLFFIGSLIMASFKIKTSGALCL
jgi:hypothetical protein